MSREERLRLTREDSAALKVAVMPTLDCLPLYVARFYNLFDTLGADVRLKPFTAHMDCDTALARGRVEGSITDLVRGQRLSAMGTPLTYVTATNAYWQLITNHNARISNLKHLDDKMVAMTRFSATNLLCDYAVDESGLNSENVFRVQINDVDIRLRMLQNNSMDAMLLTEPQATVARVGGHRVLRDSRSLDIRLGAVAFRAEALEDSTRKWQMDVFVRAYNMACDSIAKYGLAKYRQLVAECCGVSRETADSIPHDLKFTHAASPRAKDIEVADNWLKKAMTEDNYGKGLPTEQDNGKYSQPVSGRGS